MSGLVAADGRSMIDRQTVSMSAAQVQWFLHADTFMQHVPHLWALSLGLFCLHCWKKGLKDTVTVTFNDVTQMYRVRCSCSRVEGILPRARIQQIDSTDTMLRKLGWSLHCTSRCAKERGYADGVEAANDAGSGTLSVRCGCTNRVHVLAHTPTGVVA